MHKYVFHLIFRFLPLPFSFHSTFLFFVFVSFLALCATPTTFIFLSALSFQTIYLYFNGIFVCLKNHIARNANRDFHVIARLYFGFYFIFIEVLTKHILFLCFFFLFRFCLLLQKSSCVFFPFCFCFFYYFIAKKHCIDFH